MKKEREREIKRVIWREQEKWTGKDGKGEQGRETERKRGDEKSRDRERERKRARKTEMKIKER